MRLRLSISSIFSGPVHRLAGFLYRCGRDRKFYVLPVLPKRIVKDLLVHDGGCEWHISPSDPFAHTHDIGDDLFLFAGKQCTGATESYGHLVANEEDIVLFA